MLFIFAGPSCTGKSSVATELEKLIQIEVYSGKDYLRMAKNQQEAWQQFYKKLELASKNKDNTTTALVYIITEPLELIKLENLKDSIQIKFMADLELVKSRFSTRMKGNLPKPVESMIERQIETWNAIDMKFTVDTNLKSSNEIAKEIIEIVLDNQY